MSIVMYGAAAVAYVFSLGYDAQWACVSASDCRAPHQRDRIWLVANAQCTERRPELRSRNGMEREREDGISQRQEGAGRIGACREVLADSNGVWQLPSAEGWDETRDGPSNSGKDVAHADGQRQQEQHAAAIANQPRQHTGRATAEWGISGWPTEPDVGRVAYGVANRVDRLKALGNGQVPRVAATAHAVLSGR